MKFRRITEADRGRNRTMSNRPVRTASNRKKIRRERYDKSIGKWIPRYAIFSVIFCFVFNSLIYSGTQFLMRNAKHYDLTLWIDRQIPYEPDWIWIYLGCFAFLGDQLRIDHRSWQRGVVSLCSGRLSVAYYLRCFFRYFTDNEYQAF